MSKKMLIDATHAEETRVVVVDGNKVEEFDFESVNKRQLAGNIYLAKVTRVEPSLQAAFVDYGGNRHGFLAFSEIHPDYYQIPVADREALLAEEAAYAKAQDEEEERKPKARGRNRRSRKPAAEAANNGDAVVSESISGMDVFDIDGEGDNNDPIMGFEDAEHAHEADETPAENVASDEAVSTASADEVENDTAEDLYGEDDEEKDLASDIDPDIESVAQEDEQEEIRVRKPRPRRYKIQEVIKVRQILLIQVVKEERGNKGAALTTYLSLAGRYCVLMPNTARGGGISRKITNAVDRKKLKEIAGEMIVPKGAGLIIRTAGAMRTKAEIKRDYDYLMRQWEEVRDLTLKSIAPAPIYEEGSLIKRSIRDLYNREIDEILIEGEAGYRMAKDYMKMLMPSHSKNVKLYNEPLPLFARFQVESYLSGMFNPTVQLKSGGYIVIGVTEALVAIDVNSGRATKEGSIEETALKTNLEASDEVARQLRLRDLAGLIVIDYIDMEDRRNNAAVEKRIKDRLKTDRARIQVGRISGFGLMEMSRQRLRPGMIEATTAPCAHCHGTGLTRSNDSLALSILRELEEEGVRRRSREVLVTVPLAIANYILNQKREHVAMIEARYGLSIRMEASATLISPDFTIERFKTATRVIPEPPAAVVSMETSLVDHEDEDQVDDEDETDDEEDKAPQLAAVETNGDEQPKKKRRRRRRRGGRGRGDNENGEETDGDQAEVAQVVAEPAVVEDVKTDPEAADKKPARKRTTRRASDKKAKDDVTAVADAVATESAEEPAAAAPEPEAVEKPVKKPRAPRRKKVPEVAVAADEANITPEAPVEAPPTEPAPKVVPAPEPTPASDPTPVPTEADKPKRRGWWSLSK
jgi:ribonuclease E